MIPQPSLTGGGQGCNPAAHQVHCCLTQTIGFDFPSSPKVHIAEMARRAAGHHSIVDKPQSKLKGLICGGHKSLSIDPNNRGAVQ